MSTNHGANLYSLSSKYGFSKEEFMDFSSNINPFGTSSLAKQYIVNNIDMVSMYPDPDYIDLKTSISNYCKCSIDNIVLGSGATELISSFIHTINPKQALLLSPAYSEYEKELSKINCSIEKYFAKEEDNFHVEFTDTDTYSCTQLVDDYSNLFVIRGTSKFFSTPGIRLGYGLISNTNVKNEINKNLDLWNINIIASKMGEIMFSDLDFISNTISLMNTERDYLLKELKNIKSLDIYNTKGNFILCKIKTKELTAKSLREQLLPQKIIIRDCCSFEGLDEYFFRVCILKLYFIIFLYHKK